MTTKYSFSSIVTCFFIAIGFTCAQAGTIITPQAELVPDEIVMPLVDAPCAVALQEVAPSTPTIAAISPASPEVQKQTVAPKSLTRTVTIQEGEPIYLELMNDYDIDKIEVGNTVQFRVTSNVLIDGKEVIRAFSSGSGVVSRKENSTTNTSGSIQVTVRHIRAVDGKQVLVDGPTNLNNTHIGTAVTVYVKNAIDIEVR